MGKLKTKTLAKNMIIIIAAAIFRTMGWKTIISKFFWGGIKLVSVRSGEIVKVLLLSCLLDGLLSCLLDGLHGF